MNLGGIFVAEISALELYFRCNLSQEVNDLQSFRHEALLNISSRPIGQVATNDPKGLAYCECRVPEV